MGDSIYQSVLHGVGGRVHEFVHHVVATGKLHDTDLLGRPEVLPAASQRVLAAGKHLVEMLDKLGVAGEAIVDDGVMMIAHRTRE
jgi:ABC-type Fe3+-hydroxamate transport system substrate-binding protein